jgi:hypothetical protein
LARRAAKCRSGRRVDRDDVRFDIIDDGREIFDGDARPAPHDPEIVVERHDVEALLRTADVDPERSHASGYCG